MEKVMDVLDIHGIEKKSGKDWKSQKNQTWATDFNLFKDPSLPEVLPVFITIDPDRDTPEKLADYLEDYPHFLGLTGSMNQIKSVCKNYRIYFSKGPKSADGDYILDHR